MFGPIEGKRNDAFMLGVSGLSSKLNRLQKPNGEPYVIYGDPAYGLTRNILAPYRGAQITDDQQEFKGVCRMGFGEDMPAICIFGC